jgi:hypothetical protein
MTFLQARYFTPDRSKTMRLIVIHDMEWPERPDAAEGCAAMFAGPNSPRGSAHYCIDNNTWVQSVRDSDTAWGAPGVNADGLHFEHAGFASQDRKDWSDPYSDAELKVSASLVAAKCRQYGIPPTRLSNDGLLHGGKGIIGHAQATSVYGGTHTDPGAGFPWDTYIGYVQSSYNGRPVPAPNPAPQPEEDDMGVYVEPEGSQPGDGIYFVGSTGVYGITGVQWHQLAYRAGAKAVTIPRGEYTALVAQRKL